MSAYESDYAVVLAMQVLEKLDGLTCIGMGFLGRLPQSKRPIGDGIVTEGAPN